MNGTDAYTLAMFALCLWREARSEPDDGIIAVACCIRERVNGGYPGSAWWGKTYAEVITKPYQFSSMTDPNDRQLISFPKESDENFIKCLIIAESILSGDLDHPAPTATHYFADYMSVKPGWSKRATFIKHIGHHLFWHLDS